MTLSLLTIKDVGYEKNEEEEIKDAYPKKVCHMLKRHVKKRERERERCISKEGMPHAHKVCQKEKNEIDSPHPWKIKKRDGSCKGVHPSSTQNKTNILTHLHILIKLYDSFLLGSCFWLNNISKANMPLYSYPELHISLIRWEEKIRQQLCLGEDLK